jgi:hypothetical protein
VFILLSGASSLLFACGPFFPNSYLAARDQTLLEVSGFDLYNEMDRIPFDQPAEFQAVCPSDEQHRDPRQQSLQVDCQELRLALVLQGNASETVDKIVQEYQHLRAALEQYSDNARNLPDNSARQPEFSVDQIPEQVPEEFKL